MLSTLITQLTGKLEGFFSSQFVIGSFCPVLASVFLNGFAAYFLFDSWHEFVDANIIDPSAARGIFVVSSMVIAIAMAGYVLSSLSTFLRQVLEGRSWGKAADLFIPGQNRRRAQLYAALENIQNERTDLRDVPDWVEALRSARAVRLESGGTADSIEGQLQRQPISWPEIARTVEDFCTRLAVRDQAQNTSLAQVVRQCLAGTRSAHTSGGNPAANSAALVAWIREAEAHLAKFDIAASADTLAVLDAHRAQYEPIDADALEAAVILLEANLLHHSADDEVALDKQQQKLIRIMDYAVERAAQVEVRLQNELDSNYGTQDVAPTRMGNIANTIQSYALRRYHCNLESVWSNLQIVAMKDEKAPDTLADAKVRLDFLVACVWLSIVSTVAWVATFWFVIPGWIGFLIVALFGPFFSYMWYRIATEQYRSVADLMMTTFDTYRLELLTQMHLPMPSDVEEEREIWTRLDQLLNASEAPNLRYQHPKAG